MRSKISVGEMQGRRVTFRVHPLSEKELETPRVPTVSITAPFDGPYDFDDGFWGWRLVIVAQMLGVPGGFELLRAQVV